MQKAFDAPHDAKIEHALPNELTRKGKCMKCALC
jgi:hypothetical protein